MPGNAGGAALIPTASRQWMAFGSVGAPDPPATTASLTAGASLSASAAVPISLCWVKSADAPEFLRI